LIVAASGRALAQSARRAGYSPLVVDFFADDDTREAAGDCARLEPGFELDSLMTACERLTHRRRIAGLVYGPGFEDRPGLIEALAGRWRLAGNPARVVSLVKNPWAFAELCDDAEIAHPETRNVRPVDASGWLSRRRGGSGGDHIRAADAAAAADPERYFQRRVDGRAVSALVLSNRERGAILGFSEQWSAPRDGQPFRYGGAARPAVLSETIERELAAAVHRFRARATLVGLNSLDFLVSDDGFWLLEVNPRPGATIDIFEPDDVREPSLFALHLAACDGMSTPAPRLEGARASGIVFADHEIAETPKLAWPSWASDRQPAGTRVAAGDPFCSITASGSTPAEARRALDDRAATIHRLLRESTGARAA
jgi:predicted ATP-grasp superfamily ATP-dependent carboligase